MEISLNQTTFYYEVEGDGQPLILLSGYRADISSWTPIREGLAQKFKIFMIDNRGSGRSPCSKGPLSIQLMAEDIRCFIETLDIDKPHILGHSMGGAIAQVLAYQNPNLLNSILLANSFTRLREVQAFALQYFLNLRASGVTYIKALEGSLPWLLSGSFLKNREKVGQLLDWLEGNPFMQTIEGQKMQLQAILEFDSSTWVQKIKIPTLVIGGEEDILCPNDSEFLAEQISQAELEIFEGQAHLPHIEMPEEFIRVVSKFLSRVKI